MQKKTDFSEIKLFRPVPGPAPATQLKTMRAVLNYDPIIRLGNYPGLSFVQTYSVVDSSDLGTRSDQSSSKQKVYQALSTS